MMQHLHSTSRRSVVHWVALLHSLLKDVDTKIEPEQRHGARDTICSLTVAQLASAPAGAHRKMYSYALSMGRIYSEIIDPNL